MTPAAMTVAALFVRADGPYPELTPHWYDIKRDARTYEGPYPVVAHPPCARWGRFWWADGSKEPGNDGGLFEIALHKVRTYGGVLEHPEASRAFREFGLGKPQQGSWQGLPGGVWITCVAQRNYGHRCRKLTWLYYVGDAKPFDLDWSKPEPGRNWDLLGKREREITPGPFAEMLIKLAGGSRPPLQLP